MAFWRRVFVLVIFVGGVGFILVATAYPFRFRTDRASVAWKLDNVDWRLSPGRPNLDMIQNLLLMAPLGLALAGAGRARRPGRVALEAALLALILSVGVEALQVLVPGRFPQVPDILRNVCGCAAAGAASAAARFPLRRRLSARLAPSRPG